MSETAHDAAANPGAAELRQTLKRQAFLSHLLEVYGADADDKPRDAPIWESWLARSGELPPDFDALRTNAFLPDVLALSDGSLVETADQWHARRRQVLDLLEYWQLGHQPPAPQKVIAEELSAVHDAAARRTVKQVRLLFGPSTLATEADSRAIEKDTSRYSVVRLSLQVSIPDGPGPFPAVVDIGYRTAAGLAGSLAAEPAFSGYLVCIFDTLDAFAAKDVYVDYDCNELVWWAYAASRCADYLSGLPQVDRSRIAVVGHSRGGKMALIAAALDERFAAAVASHTGSGSGTVPPWRYMGERFGAETLEASTRLFPYWSHPRLRFFAGRENKLPFDSHFLMALVAPRPLLVTEGDADAVGETWGTQQAYTATQKVYELLGARDALGVAFQAGGHELPPETLAGYRDWLDMRFGRKPLVLSERLMYTYTFDEWQSVAADKVDVGAFPERGLDDLLVTDDGGPPLTAEGWPARRAATRERMLWALGDLPPVTVPCRPALTNVSRCGDGLLKADLPIDDKLVGHLTYPDGDRKLPAVIYLHAYLDNRGWDWPRGYGWGVSVGERLAQQGFLAVEYDQFGFGTRNRDCGIEFFTENPRRSAMGVMVQDVRKVVTALESLDVVDGDRIMLAGFSLGGAVGLYAAALDDRVKAVASTCGFASMRLDVHGQETEGLRRYSHLRPLLPRLGFFLGHEKRIPYDYHEVLASIAPRHTLIVAPLLDQDWLPQDVLPCYQAARGVFDLLGAADHLRIETPNDFDRYPPRHQNLVNAWLWQAAESLR